MIVNPGLKEQIPLLRDDVFAPDQIALWLQPVYHVKTGEILHHEVLARWRDHRNYLHLPEAFFPALARSGMLLWFDRQVIRLAIERMVEDEDLRLSVNLSEQSLNDSYLAEYIEESLHSSQIDAARLLFEITEKAIANNFQSALSCLQALKHLGCGVSIDNFTSHGLGEGQFQQLALNLMKVDMVKIDSQSACSFHAAIGEDLSGYLIEMHAIFGQVVIKFVEDLSTLRWAQQLDFDGAQGCYLNPPDDQPRMTPFRLPELLEESVTILERPSLVRPSDIGNPVSLRLDGLQTDGRAMTPAFNPAPMIAPQISKQSSGLTRLLALLILAMGLTTSIYLIRQYLRQPLPSLDATGQSAAIATADFVGKVQPATNFKLAALSGAIVRDIVVQVGDHVTANQPLVILENLEAKREYEQAEQQQETAQQQMTQLQAQITNLRQIAALHQQMDAVNSQFSSAQLQAQQVPLHQRQDSIKRAQATYELALVQYNRMDLLHQEGAVSQAEVDRAKADLQIAEADLSSAQEAEAASQRLEKEQQQQLAVQQQVNTAQQQQQILELQGQWQTARLQYEQATRKLQQIEQQGLAANGGSGDRFQIVIRATKDGVVDTIPVSIGDQIYAGTPVVELSQIDRLNVEVPVSSRMINSLQRGQSATVYVGTGEAALKVKAVIISISPLPSDDLNHSVKLQFKNPERQLLIGQPAKVRFANE